MNNGIGGKALNGWQVKDAKLFCSERDGFKCRDCGKKPPEVKRLLLDHIDNNKYHNPPDGTNWQLLCDSCNQKKNPHGKVKTPKFESWKTLDLSKRERASFQIHEFGMMSAELRKSEHLRPKIQAWVIQEVKAHGNLPAQEIIDGGSLLWKCSQTLVRAVVNGLKSRYGPLVLSETGMLSLRPELQKVGSNGHGEVVVPINGGEIKP